MRQLADGCEEYRKTEEWGLPGTLWALQSATSDWPNKESHDRWVSHSRWRCGECNWLDGNHTDVIEIFGNAPQWQDCATRWHDVVFDR